MIDIIAFREYVAELKSAVNEESENKIDNVVLAVKEEHMVKKLKDKSGVCLCVNYPDSQSDGTEDYSKDNNQVFFFIIEKTPAGSQNDDAEIAAYHKLQNIMLILRDAIRVQDSCTGFNSQENFKIEWEYQIFGGFNGLSIGLTLTF